MPEPGKQSFIPKPIRSNDAMNPACATGEETMACDRCGAEMFGMHTVWQ